MNTPLTPFHNLPADDFTMESSKLVVTNDNLTETTSLLRLYEAAMGRAPDTNGLEFWLNEIEAGLSLHSITNHFVHSPEFVQRNPSVTSGDNASVVADLYESIFRRTADDEGLSFWTSSGLDLAAIVLHFTESAEFKLSMESPVAEALSILQAGADLDDTISLRALKSDVSGTVTDGKIAGATVGIDVNGDGIIDASEPMVTTDSLGNFSFPKGTASGPLIATGGTDISTGLPFKGVMEAPSGSTVVTPLTTLIKHLADADNSSANQAQKSQDAQAKLKVLLGLDDITVDITQIDFVSEATEGDPDGAVDGISDLQATRLYAASIQFLNLIDQGSAIITGADPNIAPTSASSTLFRQFAAALDQNSSGDNQGPVDLGSLGADVIKSANSALLTGDARSKADALAQTASDLAAAANRTLSDTLNKLGRDAAGQETRDALVEIVKTQKSIQDDAAATLARAAGETNPNAAVQELIGRSVTPDGRINPSLLDLQVVGDVDGDGQSESSPPAGQTPSGPTAPPVPQNNAPEISASSDLTVTGTRTQTLSGKIIATDPDGDPLTFSISAGLGPSSGTVMIDQNGNYSYTPDPSFVGTDSFFIEVNDGKNATAQKVEAVLTPNDSPGVLIFGHKSIGVSIAPNESVATANAALALPILSIFGDQIGITNVNIAGPDAASFEFDGNGNGLYDPNSTKAIKFVPGTTFDPIQQNIYRVSITVDDPDIGNSFEDQAFITFFLEGVSTEIGLNKPSDLTYKPTIDSFSDVTQGENANYRIKVGEFILDTDFIGQDVVKIGGIHSQYFEIDNNSIYIKQGVQLPVPASNKLEATLFTYDPTVRADMDFAGVPVNPASPFDLNKPGQIFQNEPDSSFDIQVDIISKSAFNTFPEFLPRSDIFLTMDTLDQFVNGKLYGRDADSDPIFFDLLFGPQNGIINFGSTTGDYTYTPNANFVGQDTFTFGIGDPSGLSLNQWQVDVIVSPAPPPVVLPMFDLVTNRVALREDTDTTNSVSLVSFNILDDVVPQGGYLFSLAGPDANKFDIVGQYELILKSGTVLDFETQNQLSVTLVVDDPSGPNGPEDTATFTLDISDVNEGPKLDSTQTNSFNATVGAGAQNPTGTLNFIDEDTIFSSEISGGQTVVKIVSTGPTSHGTLTAFIDSGTNPGAGDKSGSLQWTFDNSGINYANLVFNGQPIVQTYDIFIPDGGDDFKIGTVGISLIEA